MSRFFSITVGGALLITPITAAALARSGQPVAATAREFVAVSEWLRLPEGRSQIGPMHGDVAVSSSGDVYLSVEDPLAGLQVYAANGEFRGNVSGAPSDLHGFVIRRQPDGEFIFGATLLGQTIVKMTLDGKVALTIPKSAIPHEFKIEQLPLLRFLVPPDDQRLTSGDIEVLLTGIDVAPNGDLYVVDGYASDYIHRFDRTGKYVASFGGKKEPYNFRTLHKIAIDTRFRPARIIGCDRGNGRVIHVSLEGKFLGVVASDLLAPAAVAISGDHAIVGELRGRVTILDKAGTVVARLGTNTEPGIGTNSLPPAQWRTGVVIAPHGIAVNDQGDVFVSEFNAFGRVHRFNRQ